MEDILHGSPYVGYAYAYPHKTAYRPLEPPVPLRDAWAEERKDALFLYLHVPFCERRCGYCNLFALSRPNGGLVEGYLAALERQAGAVREALGEARFARLAVGGGTPTCLAPGELRRLFALAERLFGIAPGSVPASVEVSPGTADEERLRLLREQGVSRVSLGVQSFVEAEVRAAGRAQPRAQAEQALARLRELGFPILNIDLIYGLPGQTVESWLGSLRRALESQPEELYLYPLYVRPGTGLGRAGGAWEDLRLALYRAGRDLLLASGYRQLSMRMFGAGEWENGRTGERETGGAGIPSPPLSRSPSAPLSHPLGYCCQEDGMVGLGCGARSYTRALHYADRFSLSPQGVERVLAGYVATTAEEFALARHGFLLDGEEQRRRWVIKSLLRCEGLDLAAYRRHFGSEARADLPELDRLCAAGLAYDEGTHLCLTQTGLERSDAIGPFLASARVRRLMGEWEPA